jgi:hypothetical protein
MHLVQLIGLYNVFEAELFCNLIGDHQPDEFIAYIALPNRQHPIL